MPFLAWSLGSRSVGRRSRSLARCVLSASLRLSASHLRLIGLICLHRGCVSRCALPSCPPSLVTRTNYPAASLFSSFFVSFSLLPLDVTAKRWQLAAKCAEAPFVRPCAAYCFLSPVLVLAVLPSHRPVAVALMLCHSVFLLQTTCSVLAAWRGSCRAPDASHSSFHDFPLCGYRLCVVCLFCVFS